MGTAPSATLLIFLSTLSLRRATNKMGTNMQDIKFLSTLSLRRATGRCAGAEPGRCDFYPRSPCGERRRLAGYDAGNQNFYPRSPCGERRVEMTAILFHTLFLSTLSLRRATRCKLRRDNGKIISIHALLAESDRSRQIIIIIVDNFYPRSPCGERLI